MQLNKCKICGNDIPRKDWQSENRYQKAVVCSNKCGGKSSLIKRQNKSPYTGQKKPAPSWHDGVIIKYITFSKAIDHER